MIISLLELELPVLWLAYLKAELAARATIRSLKKLAANHEEKIS